MDVIFLLGAGATVDAGMPNVAGLTCEFKKRWPGLRDVNGKHCPEFAQVFELFEESNLKNKNGYLYKDYLDPNNYEHFFRWIYSIQEIQGKSYKKIIETKIDSSLLAALIMIPQVVSEEFKKILEEKSPKTPAEYLKKFKDFLVSGQRLKIFTLNYDRCLEGACRAGEIDLTTGFDSCNRFDPSLFNKKKKGIDLYKLHGSLEWDEILLGPGNKMQADDPFLTLAYEFKRSLEDARVCVIIGYAHNDDHINTMLCKAFNGKGLKILDVNLDSPNPHLEDDDKYRHLKKTAECALLSGAIKEELESM